MNDMVEELSRVYIPAAFGLLPAQMASPNAVRFLIAIAWQESRCIARRQRDGGPARGFWQFETGGVSGVMRHASSGTHAEALLHRLNYTTRTAYGIQAAIEHNDVLAAGFARLLLWTLPSPLPTDEREAWGQYLEAWRPGKPHQDTWSTAWQIAQEFGDAGRVSR